MDSSLNNVDVFGRLMSPETLNNPYPFYKELRAAEPIAQNLGMTSTVFATYASVSAVFADKRFSNNWAGSHRFARDLDADEQVHFDRIMDFFKLWMQSNDASKHLRIRTLVNKAFTAKRIENLRARVELYVAELLASAKDKAAKNDGVVDLVEAFARPLPEMVIAEMFGLPHGSREDFSRTSAAVFAFVGTRDPGPGVLAQVSQHITDVENFLRPIIEERRKNPGDDLISLLVNGDGEPDLLTSQEIIVQCAMMLAAGHETTTALIITGFYELLRHPDQLALLKADASLIKGAVEEMLRFNSVSQWLPRLAAEDMEFLGVPMKKGHYVWLGVGAALHDENAFENPEVFDITRKPAKIISFGGGAHYCLGAMLARMQAQIAIPALIHGFKGATLAGAVAWNPNFTMRSLKTLPIRAAAKSQRAILPSGDARHGAV